MLSGDELIPRLTELYKSIDLAYHEIADEIGFSCDGCDGVTCCTVDLTLHTFAEMLYLRRGFNALDMSLQLAILGRCRAMIKSKEDDPSSDAYRNAVCTLNFEGSCSLYEHRPMICRLAGIRHFIDRPDGSTMESCGCRRYEEEVFSLHPDLKIDRTAFYRRMAEIEIEVVRVLGKRTTPRTVSETLGLEDPDLILP
jgi:Fe-S-cluster containining protein